MRYEGPRPGCVLGVRCGGPQGTLAATVDLYGKPVRVVVTHLSAPEPDGGLTAPFDRADWRAAQAQFIKQTLVDTFDGRIVVLGDFNENYDLAAPTGPLSDAHDTALARVADENGGTHCDPGHRVDLILPRHPMTTLVYNGVYCPPGLADHPRVSTALALGTLAPPPDLEPGDEGLCERKPWTPGC